MVPIVKAINSPSCGSITCANSSAILKFATSKTWRLSPLKYWPMLRAIPKLARGRAWLERARPRQRWWVQNYQVQGHTSMILKIHDWVNCFYKTWVVFASFWCNSILESKWGGWDYLLNSTSRDIFAKEICFLNTFFVYKYVRWLPSYCGMYCCLGICYRPIFWFHGWSHSILYIEIVPTWSSPRYLRMFNFCCIHCNMLVKHPSTCLWVKLSISVP